MRGARRLGFRTSFGYDAASQRVSATDALGRISTTVFDADGRTLASVNANGVPDDPGL
jgi:YD repeat-containing protein